MQPTDWVPVARMAMLLYGIAVIPVGWNIGIWQYLNTGFVPLHNSSYRTQLYKILFRGVTLLTILFGILTYCYTCILLGYGIAIQRYSVVYILYMGVWNRDVYTYCAAGLRMIIILLGYIPISISYVNQWLAIK